MSLFRLPRLTISLAVALGLVLVSAPGQADDQKAPLKATSRIAREVYAIRGGQAKDLANVLTLHFKSEPGFLVAPDPRSNSLLLSGPKSVLEEARAVLGEIDRPARTVRVEVFLIELTGKMAGESSGDGKEPERIEWAGPAREVTAKIRDLQKRGSIASVQRIQLAALEGQMARTQDSESRPYTTGVAIGGGLAGGGFPGAAGGAFPGGGRSARGVPGGGPAGPGGRGGAMGGGIASRNISYRNVGTSVQVTPEIGADGWVTLELRIENSSMRTADGVSLATDEKGTNVPATGFVTSTVESRLKVRPRQVVLAGGSATSSKSGQAETVVLVGAVTDEAGK
jgi:hypothetical protein